MEVRSQYDQKVENEAEEIYKGLVIKGVSNFDFRICPTRQEGMKFLNKEMI